MLVEGGGSPYYPASSVGEALLFLGIICSWSVVTWHFCCPPCKDLPGSGRLPLPDLGWALGRQPDFPLEGRGLDAAPVSGQPFPAIWGLWGDCSLSQAPSRSGLVGTKPWLT